MGNKFEITLSEQHLLVATVGITLQENLKKLNGSLTLHIDLIDPKAGGKRILFVNHPFTNDFEGRNFRFILKLPLEKTIQSEKLELRCYLNGTFEIAEKGLFGKVQKKKLRGVRASYVYKMRCDPCQNVAINMGSVLNQSKNEVCAVLVYSVSVQKKDDYDIPRMMPGHIGFKTFTHSTIRKEDFEKICDKVNKHAVSWLNQFSAYLDPLTISHSNAMSSSQDDNSSTHATVVTVTVYYRRKQGNELLQPQVQPLSTLRQSNVIMQPPVPPGIDSGCGDGMIPMANVDVPEYIPEMESVYQSDNVK